MVSVLRFACCCGVVMTSTANDVKWITSQPGADCTNACSEEGLACDANEFPVGLLASARAFADAGLACSIFSEEMTIRLISPDGPSPRAPDFDILGSQCHYNSIAGYSDCNARVNRHFL